MSKNTGIPYEILTKKIFELLLRQDAVHNLDVRHNIVLKGKTASQHQIDVYWKFEIGGIRYETIVQTKDWNRPVEQGELLKFRSVLDDIPGQPRGVFVTRSGYQRGAQEFARAHGILIYEIFQEEPKPIQIMTSTLGFASVRLVPMQVRDSVPGNKAIGGKPAANWFWETVAFDTEMRPPKFHFDEDWLKEQADRFGAHIIDTARATKLSRFHELRFRPLNPRS